MNNLHSIRVWAIRECGFITQAQAARILRVSGKRVNELVKLGKLRVWQIYGVKMVSFREILNRKWNPVRPGRPK